MTIWSRYPLGEVADLCLGKMLDQNKNRGELLPYLANVNVRWGEFILDDLRLMRFEEHELDRYGLRFGDIVMCEGGEPGRCAIWKDQVPGMMIQKALHRIRPHRLLDSQFVYYCLCGIGRNRGFDQYFTGATIKHLSGEQLARVEVNVPPLSIQRRIAGILSAYDDLIENSQRRIKILEEMARRLYREWFVHFRFPGHEDCRFMDSPLGEIPEGWEVKRLSELVNTQYGYTESTNKAPVGPRYLRGMDMNKCSYIDWSQVPFCLIPEDLKEAYAVRRGDVFVIRMADPGKAGIVEQDVDAVFASYLIRVRPKGDKLLPYFLFHLLDSPEYRAYISGASTGTTRKSASAAVITDFPFVLPPRQAVEQFESRASAFREQLTILIRQINNLRRARDLLLPRLLSGQIDVEALPEAAVAEP